MAKPYQPVPETLDLRHLTEEEREHIERTFWTHVHKKGYKGCWRYGYNRPLMHHRAGNIYWRRNRWGAHRFSWALHYGVLEEGMYIWHTCGVANCVNPDHLLCGNRVDMRGWRAERREAQRAIK